MRTNFGALFLLIVLIVRAASASDIDRPPINYRTAIPKNPVEALKDQLLQGKTSLDHDDDHGFLRSLLKRLDIPVSSQVLVFSKTSLQRFRIGPATPRAIYFNDEIAVGFCVRGDVLEIAAADPVVGTVFYSIDQDVESGAKIVRQTDRCLQCHESTGPRGYPGHLVRSVSAAKTGEPIFSMGTRRVDHSTPFEERWGGWFVTGTSGKQQHRGNRMFAPDTKEPIGKDGVNVTDLKAFLSPQQYLAPSSDIVALMVLEHQNEGHNRLVRANFLTRLAQAERIELNKALGQPADQYVEGITRRIASACEPVVEYFLFSKEAPLTDAIVGTSPFAADFEKRGPIDAKGRSLRTFDLQTRLFRYPLSYLIYSQAFAGLPNEAKDFIYVRLRQVLTNRDHSGRFDHLSAEDRVAILEILEDTLPALPKNRRQ